MEKETAAMTKGNKNGPHGVGAGKGRRPYVKPAAKRIRLAAEEVLAVGCKMAGGTGPRATCQLGSPCPTAGS